VFFEVDLYVADMVWEGERLVGLDLEFGAGVLRNGRIFKLEHRLGFLVYDP
jgi:hypothetical protein